MDQLPISMDDWLKSRPKVLSLDEYVSSRPKIYSPAELEQESGAIYKQKVAENKATLMDVIGSSLEQFGYDFIHSLTFGLADKPESSKPINQIAGVAGSIGDLAGLLLGPGKLLKAPTRLMAGALRGGAIKVLGKTAGSLVAHGASEVAGMSLLGLASDLNADPVEMAKNAKDFGIMGAVFGAAKMIHIPAHPILGFVLRQTGTRAMMKVAGMYPEGYLNKENLPGIVWQEALNTFFTMRGITPQEIISGSYKSEADRKLVTDITDGVINVTAPLKTDPIEIGKESFTKPVKQTVQMKDIIVDENLVDPIQRAAYKGQIRLKKNPIVELEFDPTTKKYNAGKFNSAIAAYRDEIMARRMADEAIPDSIPALVRQSGKYMKTRLSTPAETMFRVTGKDKADQMLLDQLQNADEIVMTASEKSLAGKATSISESSAMSPAKLTDNQVTWRRVVSDGTATLVPVKVAKNLEGKVVWKGKTIPTEDVYKKMQGIANEITRLRSLESVEGNKKAGFQAKMLEGKLKKIEKSLATDAKSGIVSYETVGEKPIKGQFDLNKMYEKAMKDYSLIKSMPEKDIPDVHIQYMKKRFINTGLGAADFNTLLRSLKIKNDRPKLMHLPLLEERLREIEATPLEARMHVLMGSVNKQFKLLNVPLTGENKERQDNAEVSMRLIRKAKMAKFEAEFRKDPTGPSPLSRAITQKFFGSWLDVRYPMQSIEEATGIPMHRLYRKLSNAFYAKKNEHTERTKRVVLFSKASPEDQRAVEEHYDRILAGKDPDWAKVTEYQKSYIDAIDNMMGGDPKNPNDRGLRDSIFEHRYRVWVDNVFIPGNERKALRQNLIGKQYEKLENVRDVSVFHSQNDPEIRALLESIRKAEVNGEVDKATVLKRTAVDKYSLGLIRKGAYLPEVFTRRNTNKLSKAELIAHIDALNKGPFTERKIKLSSGKEMDLNDMILEAQMKETNLSKRLENYVSQVLNVKHFDEPLRALDTIGEIFYNDLRDAKPNAFMRNTPEAKAYSMADSLTLWSTRLKGFPIKIGGLGRALKATQTVFFRSLTVRPMLIARNVPQRIVTAPNKIRMLMNMGRGKKFSKLPEDAKRFFDVEGVVDADAIGNQFLELESNFKWDKVPVLSHIWKFAGEVGKLYAMSDWWNKKSVYSKMWFNTSDAIKEFRDGRINQATMEQRSAIHKMKPLEQREFREDLELGNDSHAASTTARWHAVNSQWYYGRQERSLQEMTAEGETYTNLLTWSKSMAQQVYHTYESFTDGWKRYEILKAQGKGNMLHGPAGQALRQSYDAVAQIVGLGIAGGVANALLNTVSLNHKGRYQAYGFGMLTWQMGGVTQEILTSFTSGLAGVVESFDGTPDEQKAALANLAKMADNVAIRQLFPFAKSALSVMEAYTGKSYMTPVYTLFSKYAYGYPKGVKLVDRTFLERFTHGLLSTDPNKSESVKRWAFDHLRETEARYAAATNPAEKAYLWTQVEQYKYFNDLFQRYTPYEAQKVVDQQQRVKWTKDAMMDINQYEYNLQKQMNKLSR